MSSTLTELRRGTLAGARRLDLAGAGLTTVPPEVFACADTLEILDLGRNRLDGLPHDLARLHRLRVLFCSGTPFRVLPEVLGDCASLTQVGFRGCGIETVPSAALPPGLRWLTLTDNRISHLPASLGERPALRKLMLAGNRLAGLPETLAGHPSLELLRLAANRFETLPGLLATLPCLAWLAFGANPAEGPAPLALATPAVPRGALALGPLLGEGASGRVHAARWNGRDVALKQFRGAVTSDGLPAHEMAAALAVSAHPNLLGGLARVEAAADGAPGLILPLLPPGWQPLAGPPSLETCTRDVYDPALTLAADAVRAIVRGIAAAGAHLAAHGLLHGDLYAHNIHWDGTGGAAVLGDFGAASIRPRGADLAAFDMRAWGILAGELLDRVPGDAVDAPLGALRDAALASDPGLRPRFADILDALAPTLR